LDVVGITKILTSADVESGYRILFDGDGPLLANSADGPALRRITTSQ